MNIKKTLLNYLLLAMFSHYLFMDSFFLRMLDDILKSEYFFTIEMNIFDIFINNFFDDILSCLISVMLDQVIYYQLVNIEQMS